MIHLSEISMVVIESTAAFISSYLLSELAKAKVSVLFCDLAHNPVGQYLPLYGAHDCYRRIKEQIAWEDDVKDELWRRVVVSKIRNQEQVLRFAGLEQAELLSEYRESVQPGDATNREGHAAKVYFNALFGTDFNRHQENNVNARLNYGYSLLLAWLNREIASRGYLTAVGIHHCNDYNPFNLACDFLEPFRPIIDLEVISNLDAELDKEEKIRLISLFEKTFPYSEGTYRLSSILSLSTKMNFGILANRLKPSDYQEFLLDEV